MIKRLSESSVKVCCGKQGCPVIEKIDDDKIEEAINKKKNRQKI